MEGRDAQAPMDVVSDLVNEESVFEWQKVLSSHLGHREGLSSPSSNFTCLDLVEVLRVTRLPLSSCV